MHTEIIMSGGIFINRPFHVNPKCVWFSILVMLAYWYAVPEPNTWLLPVFALVAYVSMAWYDYFYMCNDQLFPGGMLDFTAIFKPEPTTRSSSKGKLRGDATILGDQEERYLATVYTFHALFIAPFLMYVGYYGTESDPKSFGLLLGLGVIAQIYHTWRMFNPRQAVG